MLWKMNNTVVVKSDKFKSKLALICPLTHSEVEVGNLLKAQGLVAGYAGKPAQDC
jgi:hypothetical protein